MSRAKKPSISRLVKAASDYKQNLLNQNILVIGTRGSEVKAIELRFLARHFKHLTGVETIPRDLPSSQFFRMCVNHAISPDDLDYDITGKATLKLDAARAMFAPDLSAQAFGEANGARLHIASGTYAGNTWASLGFVREGGGRLDPMTLLRSPLRDEVLPANQYKVVAVLAKPIKAERYEEFRKLPSPKLDWSAIVQALPTYLEYLS